MYKIEFYVPGTHLESVKYALFEAGAGKIGEYDNCCWQIEGEGQFRPSLESNPHIGVKGKLEQLKEWKVELVCEDHVIRNTIKTLIDTHPYEEPAYNIIKIMDKSMFL
jgi:hypothetical protein